MIRPNDFDIRFEAESAGAVVRVTHVPTGNQRIRLATPSDKVGRVRDALIAELQEKLFRPNDVRVDIGRSTGGDFICVTHIPSGIQRRAMRRDRSVTELLDEVLDELYSDPAKLRQIQESVHKPESGGN
jgi:hypothetical protein